MAFRYESKRELDKHLNRSDSDEDDSKNPSEGPAPSSESDAKRRPVIRVQRIAKYQEPAVEPIIGKELNTKTPVGKAKGIVNPTTTLKREAAYYDDQAATSLALAKYDEEFADYLRDPLNFDKLSPESSKKPSSSKVQPRKSRKSSSSTLEEVDVSMSPRKTAVKSGRASRSSLRGSSNSTRSPGLKKSHRLTQETLIGKPSKSRKEKRTRKSNNLDNALQSSRKGRSRVRSKSSSRHSSASTNSRRPKKSLELEQVTLIGKPSKPKKEKASRDINNLDRVLKPARKGRSRVRSKLSQHRFRPRRSKSKASSTNSKYLEKRKKQRRPSMYANYKKMLKMQAKSKKSKSKLDETARKSSRKLAAPKPLEEKKSEPQSDGGFGRTFFGPSPPSAKKSQRSQRKLSSTTESSSKELRSSRSSSRSQSKRRESGRKTFGPSRARQSGSKNSTTGSDRQSKPSASKQAKTLMAQCENFVLYGGSGSYEKKKTLNLVIKSGSSSYVAKIPIKINSDKPNADFKIGEYSLKP